MVKDKVDDKEKEYARLGRALERVLIRDNIRILDNWVRFIGVSFLRGLFVGLGTIVGATILVGLIIWLLNVFGGLPVVGEWFDNLQESLRVRDATGL